jgi:hypothetical protein
LITLKNVTREEVLRRRGRPAGLEELGGEEVPPKVGSSGLSLLCIIVIL